MGKERFDKLAALRISLNVVSGMEARTRIT